MRRAALDAVDLLNNDLSEMADRFRHQSGPLLLRPEHDRLGETLRDPGHHVRQIHALLAFNTLAHQFVDVAVQTITHRITPSLADKAAPTDKAHALRLRRISAWATAVFPPIVGDGPGCAPTAAPAALTPLCACRESAPCGRTCRRSCSGRACAWRCDPCRSVKG